MKREIKFRAWSILGSRFWYFDYTTGFNAENNDCFSSIMQFTGLKDKNGVEIYEGDILKRVTVYEDGGCDVHLGVITWDDCSYYSRSIKNEISRSLGGKSDNTTYEVIGNIHENPELLC